MKEETCHFADDKLHKEGDAVCVLADITCEFKEFLFCPVMPLFGPVLKT